MTSFDPALISRCAAVRLLVLDVDGVLTDGRLYYGANGEQLKTFHVHDGYGLRRLLDAGIGVAIISGRRSGAVAQRMSELGIERVHLGCGDKAPVLRQMMQDAGLDQSAVAVVADDVPDLPMMTAAGFSVAVADAQPAVRAAADWVTSRCGGRGAVREVCELLLAAKAPKR